MFNSVIKGALEVLLGTPLALWAIFGLVNWGFSKHRDYDNGVLEKAAAILHNGLGMVEYKRHVNVDGLVQEEVTWQGWFFRPTFNFYYTSGRLDRLYKQTFFRNDNINQGDLLAEYDQQASELLGQARQRFAHLFALDAEVPTTD